MDVPGWTAGRRNRWTCQDGWRDRWTCLDGRKDVQTLAIWLTLDLDNMRVICVPGWTEGRKDRWTCLDGRKDGEIDGRWTERYMDIQPAGKDSVPQVTMYNKTKTNLCGCDYDPCVVDLPCPGIQNKPVMLRQYRLNPKKIMST